MTQKFLSDYQERAEKLSGKTVIGVEYTGKNLQITCSDGDVFLFGAYREIDDGRAYMNVHFNPPSAKLLEDE